MITPPYLTKWNDAIDKRKSKGLFRELKIATDKVDFSSNDYLGLSRDPILYGIIAEAFHIQSGVSQLGSTGSRLISGHNKLFEETEAYLAQLHSAEASLLFNSGYVANLAVFSSLPQKGDTILYDELSHASIKDGIRLSFADRFSFLHNDLANLENKLQATRGQVYVAVEAVYSMDGDFAPLRELSLLCNKYHAVLIVDEAHSTGLFGENGSGLVCELGLEHSIPIRIHTFGKAMGVHGAAIVGSEILIQYLINFARPFIYTTAMPPHSVVAIRKSYEYLTQKKHLQLEIKEVITFFNRQSEALEGKIDSTSGIQAIVVPGESAARQKALYLQQRGFDVRPILSPTVKLGSERLRICLHTYNTQEEIAGLIAALME